MFVLAFLALLVGSAAQSESYAGTVLHERPDLYEADGVTLRDGVTLKPLRLLASRPETGAVGDALGKLVPILRQAVGQINNSTDLLPDYVVELHLADSMCMNQMAVQSTLRLIWNHKSEDGYFKTQFGPLCSGPTGVVNDMIQVFNMFQVAAQSRGPDLANGYRYPYLCRTSPALRFVADGAAHLVMLFGWSQVGAVQDSSSLSAATVTEFRMKAMAAAYDFDYAFDEGFLAANHYTIDRIDFSEEDSAKAFKDNAVKIALVALRVDIGAEFYCQLYKQGYAGRAGMVTILASSGWEDVWIAQEQAYGSLTCTSEEIFGAAQYMLSMAQTAFLPSTMPHDITGATLKDIYQAYLQDCTADGAEGCDFDFAAYDYDGLALVAKAFHVWIYDQGHNLSEIDYVNPAPREQLHEIVKSMSFIGVTGKVDFFDQMNLDCERKGTFSVRQYLALAVNRGDQGWSDVTSFTTSDGFATLAGWREIVWPDKTVTFFGSSRTGFPDPRSKVGSPTTYFGGGYGFENVPVDVVICSPGMYSDLAGCIDCPAGKSKSGEDSKPCEPCDVGRFSKAGSANCQTCDAGQYQDLPGQQSCKNCTRGTISSGIACVSCPPGRHQPEEGKIECLVCEIGYYQPDDGRADCEVCPQGRTTRFVGALSIGECVCGNGTREVFPASAGDPHKCEPCSGDAGECEACSMAANAGPKTGGRVAGLAVVGSIALHWLHLLPKL